MLFGTLLGVLVIPILYMLFEGLQEPISGPPKERLEQLQREEAEQVPAERAAAAPAPRVPVAG